MTNLNQLKPVGNITPFAKFCCTIGNLPSSYLASWTYEEQLLWFCDYLQNTVIPAVNTNAEAVTELQGLYVQLKNYVEHYFDNLDVQNQINNKLDEMASDGTLENIINNQIFSQINSDISDLKNDVTVLNNLLNNNYYGNTIFVGDSYGNKGVYPTTDTWVDYMIKFMNLTLNSSAFNFCHGGSGFTDDGVHITFLNALKSDGASIQDKSLIKNIIVCGGANDYISNESQIKSAIKEFVNYCKTTYPNAKIYIGMIGTSGTINAHSDRRASNLYNVFNAYSSCADYGASYLNGVEYVMHNGIWIQEDGIHPTSTGQVVLGRAIYQAFTTGYFELFYGKTEHKFGDYLTVQRSISANKLNLLFNGQLVDNIELSGYQTINKSIGIIDKNFLNPVDNFSQIPVQVMLIVNGARYLCPGFIKFILSTGEMRVSFSPTINTGTITNIIIYNTQYMLNLLYF